MLVWPVLGIIVFLRAYNQISAPSKFSSFTQSSAALLKVQRLLVSVQFSSVSISVPHTSMCVRACACAWVAPCDRVCVYFVLCVLVRVVIRGQRSEADQSLNFVGAIPFGALGSCRRG